MTTLQPESDWWLASDGNWYRPELHPDNPPKAPVAPSRPSLTFPTPQIPAHYLQSFQTSQPRSRSGVWIVALLSVVLIAVAAFVAISQSGPSTSSASGASQLALGAGGQWTDPAGQFSVAWPAGGSRVIPIGVSNLPGVPVVHSWFVTVGPDIRDIAQYTTYPNRAQATNAITIVRATRKASSATVGGLPGIDYSFNLKVVAGESTQAVWLAQSGSQVFQLMSTYPASSAPAASSAQAFAQSLKILH